MRRFPKVLVYADNGQSRGELLMQVNAHIDEAISPFVELTHAATLADLHEAVNMNRFDALFLICSLDSESWGEPLSRIRKIAPDVPIIVLSPARSLRRVPDILQAGAFDCLIPPFGMDSLLAVVEQSIASMEARLRYHAGEPAMQLAI